MPTVVSVTPLRLIHDSRAYRAALTFKRLGWLSIVVEAAPSGPGLRDLPFKLIPLSGGGQGGATTASKGRVRGLLPGAVWALGAFVWFVTEAFIVNIVRGLMRVPRADVYYLHEYRLFPMVWLLARRHGARIVYDAHDFYPGVHADADVTAFWRRVFRPFLGWLEGLCIRRAAAMVTVNQGIADLYTQRFGVTARVTRNCHDAGMDVPVERGIRETLGLTDADFLLVTVGNRKAGQHIAPALDAMAALSPDVHLAFVGRGYGEFTGDIRARGLDGRVHSLAALPANRVVPFIRSASAALMLYYARSPNDVHFLPNGFFHGLAAGLPTLYPGLRWIKETAGALGIGIEIDPADADAIRRGVEGLRERIAAGEFGPALERAGRELSWHKEEQVLKDLIGEIAGGANDG